MYSKLKKKIVSIFSKKHVAPHLTKKLWDEQYSSGAWDYLQSDKEREHYLVIIDFLFKHNIHASVLDIGCGTGVLYNYLKAHVDFHKNAISYFGIDISDSAIAQAKENHGDDLFATCDFEKQGVAGQYSCIIFNETLYYFNDVMAILSRCVKENMLHNGKLIISMVEYERHYTIWEMIETKYKVLDEMTVVNEEGTSWNVKMISL